MFFNTLKDSFTILWLRLKLEVVTLFFSVLTVNRHKKQQKNNKALVIAKCIPPYTGGGVHRPLSWLKYAKVNGWQTDVLTYSCLEPIEAGLYLEEQIPSDVDRQYIERSKLRPSWQLTPRVDGGYCDAIEAANKYLPWVRKQQPKVILVSGPSFNLFITAFFLSRACGAKLVLDYRDEWSLNPFTFVCKGNRDEAWEKRVCKAADSIIYTTASIKDAHQKWLNFNLTNKLSVIPNGWESERVSSTPVEFEFVEGALSITFLGTMGHATLPESFLSDIKKLLDQPREGMPDLVINIVGTQVPEAIEQINAFKHTEKISVYGEVSKHVVQSTLKNSDILLLLVPTNMERYIPGKLFEYIAARKPILVHGVEGEASRIVESLGVGCYVPSNDVEKLYSSLKKMTNWQIDNDDRVAHWLSVHSRAYLAKQLYSVLGEL